MLSLSAYSRPTVTPACAHLQISTSLLRLKISNRTTGIVNDGPLIRRESNSLILTTFLLTTFLRSAGR